MHKCTSYGPDKLNICPFWPLFDPCDLDLQPTWKKCFKWHFSSSRAKTVQHYFEIHAQMYKLCSGQAQFMYMTIVTFIWPLWRWPSTYRKMFQMALFLLKGNNCAKLFRNPYINVQVMFRTNPDGRTDALTHAHTPNKTCNNYASLTRKRARQKWSHSCMRPSALTHSTVLQHIIKIFQMVTEIQAKN